MSQSQKENNQSAGQSAKFDWLQEEPEVKQLEEYYELRGVIGRGGYADIWVAKDLRNKRTVAVKSLHEDKIAEPKSRNAFLQEARIMMYLQHDGVVPVYDFFKDDKGCLHIIMKLVMGRTLDDLLKQLHDEYISLQPRDLERTERKRLIERLEIFLKVCDMVAYAHKQGIIHRDLKPANIMLGKQDDIYVVDWGIAEPYRAGVLLQTPEETMGTLRYLAPEIIRRKKYDERSDIYSLGVVLFELTYLHGAFMQQDDKEACYCVVSGRTSLRKHDYGFIVPVWLEQIITDAMCVDPAWRMPSVAVMIKRIRHGIDAEASFLNRLKRFIGL